MCVVWVRLGWVGLGWEGGRKVVVVVVVVMVVMGSVVCCFPTGEFDNVWHRLGRLLLFRLFPKLISKLRLWMLSATFKAVEFDVWFKVGWCHIDTHYVTGDSKLRKSSLLFLRQCPVSQMMKYSLNANSSSHTQSHTLCSLRNLPRISSWQSGFASFCVLFELLTPPPIHHPCREPGCMDVSQLQGGGSSVTMCGVGHMCGLSRSAQLFFQGKAGVWDAY